MTTLDDAATFIQQRMPELGPGRLFKDEEASTAIDPAVTVYDWMITGGTKVFERPGRVIEPQRFKVVARSVDVQAARDLIGRIRSTSDTHGGTFNGNRYLRTEPVTSIFSPEPPDAKNRKTLGFIFEMMAAY